MSEKTMPFVNDFKERLYSEISELEVRLGKLEDFIKHNDAFVSLPTIQQSLLQIQLRAMSTYYYCLKERIAHLD